MKLFDIRHPFFRPVWRRVATVALALGWAVVEIAGGNVFWAILFGSIGLYAAWEFFVIYDPANYEERKER
jgi:hypothetical protein